ncbi:MAG: DUF3857 domain-containing protein, partial [Bacteroidales bacterium]|nr:DUF3857 domain-containing protein [Bacteroidales bacterium]
MKTGHFILFITVVILCKVTIAQKKPMKWGNVSVEEFEMKVYDKDSSSVAVVLCDYGYSQDISFKRHTRIKIIKEEEVQYANRKILYRQGNYSYLAPKSIKGQTYNLTPEGKIEITKLNQNEVYTKEIFDNLYQKSFALPAVTVGSVIEYCYTIPGSPFRDWEFQSEIPTVWSEARFVIPYGIECGIIEQGSVVFEVKEE